MAAAGAEAERGEAGARCPRPPGPLPRPKPRRTARWAGRRRADTPSAGRSRPAPAPPAPAPPAAPAAPAPGPGRAGPVRAWFRVPRARVLVGGVCARAASWKGEQESARAPPRSPRSPPPERWGAGLRCGARVRAGLECLREKRGCLQTQPLSLQETLGSGGGPAGTCGLFYVDAEAREGGGGQRDPQCACVRPSRAPFESPGFVKRPGMKRGFFSSFPSPHPAPRRR